MNIKAHLVFGLATLSVLPASANPSSCTCSYHVSGLTVEAVKGGASVENVVGAKTCKELGQGYLSFVRENLPSSVGLNNPENIKDIKCQA